MILNCDLKLWSEIVILNCDLFQEEAPKRKGKWAIRKDSLQIMIVKWWDNSMNSKIIHLIIMIIMIIYASYYWLNLMRFPRCMKISSLRADFFLARRFPLCTTISSLHADLRLVMRYSWEIDMIHAVLLMTEIRKQIRWNERAGEQQSFEVAIGSGSFGRP